MRRERSGVVDAPTGGGGVADAPVPSGGEAVSGRRRLANFRGERPDAGTGVDAGDVGAIGAVAAFAPRAGDGASPCPGAAVVGATAALPCSD